MSGPDDEQNPPPEEDLGQEPLASEEETDYDSESWYDELYIESLRDAWSEHDRWLSSWSISNYDLSLTEDVTSSSDDESEDESDREPEDKPESRDEAGPEPKDKNPLIRY